MTDFSTLPRQRHYHIEDIDGSVWGRFGNFREAVSNAWGAVQNARRQGARPWKVSWHDSLAGYHRWRCEKDELEITVIPCSTESCTIEVSEATWPKRSRVNVYEEV